MELEKRMTEKQLKELNKIENPTLQEILELSKKLNVDSMLLVQFFIEKEREV